MDGESEILLNCNWIWPVLEVTYRLIVNSNLIIFYFIINYYTLLTDLVVL